MGSYLPHIAAIFLLFLLVIQYCPGMQKADPQLNNEFKLKLQAEFARRMRVNSRYSIRAFANHIGINSSTLSQILSGKRMLSIDKIITICKKIGITPPQDNTHNEEYSMIDLDNFAVISDWYHFAILDLTLIKSFKADPKWIAHRLSIQPIEASHALERLKRLGLLIEKDGQLVKSKNFFSNYSEGATSAALKEYQRQIINKALIAIDSCAQDLKDITSITIAADSKKILQAKEKIKRFRRDLCKFMESGDRDCVFHFALQLYPVTNLDN